MALVVTAYRFFSKRFTLLFIIASCFLMEFCNGWGKEGHEIVAKLAYERLAPHDRNKIREILRVDNDNGVDDPLEMIANWADHVRYTKQYHWSARLHFIDVHDKRIPGGCPAVNSSNCHFVYSRDCVRDFCVAGAILNYTQRMIEQDCSSGSSASLLRHSAACTNETLAESLKFLTHFVGDIHQPLHSARGSDYGGNSIPVTMANITFKNTRPARNAVLWRYADIMHSHHWNLHAVWDSGLIDRAIHETSRKDFEAEVFEQTKGLEFCAGKNNNLTECVIDWGEESFRAAMEWAYMDVNGEEVAHGATIGDLYYHSRLPIVKERLAAGAVRLATILEMVLGDSNNNNHNVSPDSTE